MRREEAVLLATKRLVNNLCAEVGAAPTYGPQELEPVMRELGPGLSLFDVLPLTACVKRVLEQRDGYGLGPVAVEELFGTLLRGGFDFTVVSGKGRREQLQGLADTLVRNRHWFVRTRDGKWGVRGYSKRPRWGRQKADVGLGDDGTTGRRQEGRRSNAAGGGQKPQNGERRTQSRVLKPALPHSFP